MRFLFYRKYTFSCLISGFIGLHCGTPVVAQDRSDDSKKKKLLEGEAAHISLIALGPVPQRRYKTSGKSNSDDRGDVAPRSLNLNSIPVLLPTLVDSVPPPALYYKLSKATNGSSWGRMRVGFNASTSVTKVHAGESMCLNIKDASQPDGYRAYLNLAPLKPWTQSVIFLVSSHQGKTPWKKTPHMSVLDMHSKALLGKSVLVENFSNKPVVFSLDNMDPIRLKVGEKKTYEVVHKKGRLHRITATYHSTRVLIFKSALRVPDGTLSIFAFYNANPKTNGGKKVGVVRVVINQLSPEDLNKKMTLP